MARHLSQTGRYRILTKLVPRAVAPNPRPEYPPQKSRSRHGDEGVSKRARMRDPLEKLNAIIPWLVFEKPLAKTLKRSEEPKGGRPVSPSCLMFKNLVPQAMYIRLRGSGRVRHPGQPAVIHAVPRCPGTQPCLKPLSPSGSATPTRRRLVTPPDCKFDINNSATSS